MRETTEIIKDEYTAKEVALVILKLKLSEKLVLPWLNWMKNSAEIFHPSGELDRHGNRVTKRLDPLMAKYTFADLVLVTWARSVTSGNIRQTKLGGVGLLAEDVIAFAPDVLKQIKIIQKKYEKAGVWGDYSKYTAVSSFSWNNLTVNCLYLTETVIRAIVVLEQKNMIVRK